MTTVEELPNLVGFRLVPAQPILWQRPMKGGRVEMLLHVFIISAGGVVVVGVVRKAASIVGGVGEKRGGTCLAESL